MKKVVARIALTLLLFAASGSRPLLADSGPMPTCLPNPCPVN